MDASLALKWVQAEDYTAEAEELLGDWQRQGIQCLAPALLVFETTNVLYRATLPTAPAPQPLHWIGAALTAILSVVQIVPPDAALSIRAAAMAALLGLPAAYDTQYAALAEAHGCELWTADVRFWTAARTTFPWVRWIGQRTGSGT